MSVAGSCSWPADATSPANRRPKGNKRILLQYICIRYNRPISCRMEKDRQTANTACLRGIGHNPRRLVWIGGNNNKEVSRQVFFVNWDGEKQQLHITELPPLPMPLDNLSATYADGCLYVAGGKGKPQTVPIGQEGSQTAPTNPLFSLQLTPSLQKEWVRLPDFPGPARVQPVLTAQQSEDGIRLYRQAVSSRHPPIRKPLFAQICFLIIRRQNSGEMKDSCLL